jgi:RNA polymerase sigma factor (sigma-70 family)
MSKNLFDSTVTADYDTPRVHPFSQVPLMPAGAITPIQNCLDRLRAGDSAARAELLRVSGERLLLMTRKMLSRYQGVRRWEESDDVLQNVLLRLHRALEKVPLEATRDFLAIAAENIRRELIDLFRHYYGPEGIGANHATPDANHAGGPLAEAACDPQANDPAARTVWRELHEQVDALAEEEREVVDLLWYHGMTQSEVAALLDVSVRTVRRRWQTARLRLAEVLRAELPL